MLRRVLLHPPDGSGEQIRGVERIAVWLDVLDHGATREPVLNYAKFSQSLRREGEKRAASQLRRIFRKGPWLVDIDARGVVCDIRDVVESSHGEARRAREVNRNPGPERSGLGSERKRGFSVHV